MNNHWMSNGLVWRLRQVALASIAIGSGWVGACDDGGDPQTGGETHWLSPCDTMGDCGDGLTCICGFCSRPCDGAETCTSEAPATCRPAGAGTYSSACAASPPPSEGGYCLPSCVDSSDCAAFGSGADCIEGVCWAGEPRVDFDLGVDEAGSDGGLDSGLDGGDDLSGVADGGTPDVPETGDTPPSDEPDAIPSEPDCVFVDFTPVSFALPLRFSWRMGWVVYSTAAGFEEQFGVAPPPDVDFSHEWIMLFSGGSPGVFMEPQSIEFCPSSWNVTVEVGDAPQQCRAEEWEFQPPYTIVKFDAPAAENPEERSGYGLLEGVVDCSDGAGLGGTCSERNLCQPGLACAGLTRSREGQCVEADQIATVTNTVATPIPDNDGEGVTSTNVIAGLTGVGADLVVLAIIDHPDPGDLKVWLVSPTGDEHALWDQTSDTFIRLFGEDRAIYSAPPTWQPGSDVNGTWSLRIADVEAGNAGQLEEWTLTATVTPD